jgi:hypothetical protein
MTAARLGLVSLVAALAVAVLPSGSGAANECNGVPRCIHVQGPWVAVPISGEAEYMLECPQGRGVIAGTDALASSLDIHATFDAILGSPVAFGRSTGSSVLFRAVSGRHRPGLFKPFVGCIPSPTQLRNTIATQATPVGPPLELKAVVVKLSPGVFRAVSISCGRGQRLVDSWSARAFASAKPPPAALATAIELQTRINGRRAQLSIGTSEALPANAHAGVQLGVRCASA